jgi:nitrogen regulatory protein P-II 1
MKKIEVIMKPFQLDEIRDELQKIGISEMIVSDIRCSYNPEKKSESYLSDDYFVEFLPKIRIEIFTTETEVEKISTTLKKIISTDANLHGRIFVHEVTEV